MMMKSILMLTLVCALSCSAREAEEFGFSPERSGVANAAALQKALDAGGTVTVRRPGDYKLASTVLIGDDTTLDCGAGVRFVKSLETKKFSASSA